MRNAQSSPRRAPLVTEGRRSEHNRQIIADRTRTIDQVKRLYAVVMGFALTTCFANIYACTKLIDIFSTYMFTLFAEGVCFVSLIVLFYLGAERLFENRYLRPESKVPSRPGLFIDLFTSGATAVWFVILADTFPDATKYNNQMDMEVALAGNVKFFAVNLLLLYIFDSAFLLIQIWRTNRHAVGDYELIIRNHWFWFKLNAACGIGLFPVIINFPEHWITSPMVFIVPTWLSPLFSNYIYLSTYIVVIHVVRFMADYLYAFESYYPVEEVASQQGLSQESSLSA